jgi:O-antigen/teichoic acid export membrane protein
MNPPPSSAPERPARTNSLTRNAFYNAAGFVWSAAVLLFQVTYVLNSLGQEQYGIWAICLVLTSTFAVFDFGLAATIVKFVSEFHAKGSAEDINRVLTNSFLFTLCIDLLVAPVFFLLDPIMTFLNVAPELLPTAVAAGSLALINFMLTVSGLNLYSGLLQGYHRLDLTNRVLMISGIPKIAGTIVAVEMGYGVVGVVVSDLLVVLFNIGLLWRYARRVAPEAHIAWRYRSWETFRSVFRFGVKLQASVLSGLINFHFDKFVLSRMLGLVYLTYYDLGSRVVGKVRGLPLIVATALLPEMSRLSALNEKEAIRSTYERSSKFMLLFLLPVFGSTALLSDILINLWLGSGYELASLTLQVLSFSYCINVFTAVVSNTSKGLGAPEYEARTAAIQVALNVTLSPLLVRFIGFPGALVGTSTALIVGALYYVVKVNRLLEIEHGVFLRRVVAAPVLCASASLLISYAALSGLESAGFGESPIGQIGLTVMGLVLVFGFFFVLMFRTSYLSREDQDAVKRLWFHVQIGRRAEGATR